MTMTPGIGDYDPTKQKTIHDLELHETVLIYVGKSSNPHELDKYIRVMKVEGGWIYGVDTQSPAFVPHTSVRDTPDRTVEAPPLTWINEHTGTGERTPPPTTEYVNKKRRAMTPPSDRSINENVGTLTEGVKRGMKKIFGRKS